LATEMAGRVDVFVNVKGSGKSSQAGAVTLGLARALKEFRPDLDTALRAGDFLTRDARMVDRKKYGHKKARKSFQSPKGWPIPAGGSRDGSPVVGPAAEPDDAGAAVVAIDERLVVGDRAEVRLGDGQATAVLAERGQRQDRAGRAVDLARPGDSV